MPKTLETKIVNDIADCAIDMILLAVTPVDDPSQVEAFQKLERAIKALRPLVRSALEAATTHKPIPVSFTSDSVAGATEALEEARDTVRV